MDKQKRCEIVSLPRLKAIWINKPRFEIGQTVWIKIGSICSKYVVTGYYTQVLVSEDEVSLPYAKFLGYSVGTLKPKSELVNAVGSWLEEDIFGSEEEAKQVSQKGDK